MQDSRNLKLPEDPAIKAALECVLAPLNEAGGLPNAVYASPASIDADYAGIFEPGWACIGNGADIAEPGMAQPVDLLGRPLVMIRDRKGDVRVFHNVCSHRGMKLVPEPAERLRVIRCPYHHWCYGMDGALQATPSVGGPGVHEHPDFDRGKNGLKEIRSAVWFDLIFVNISGDAPAFEDWIAPLADRWSGFKDARLVHGGPDSRSALEIKANWKFAIENYCESYHLPAIHPALNSYSRLEDHYNIDDADSFSGQGSLVYNPVLAADGRSLPVHPGLPEKWDTGAEYASLFPNLLLGIHKDHFFSVRLEPLSESHTMEHLDIYYFDDGTARDDADLRSENLRIWGQVFREDIIAVEGMQAGRSSPGFNGGAFSPAMDGPTHVFHRWVAERLLGRVRSNSRSNSQAAAE